MVLNDKQKRFCEEYSLDFNQTRAYKVAYPNTKTDNAAAASAAKLLRNTKVQAFLSQIKRELREDNKITSQMVINELAKLAFHNVQDFVNGGNSILELKYIDKDKTAAVAGVKTKSRVIPGKDGKTPQVETETEIKFHSKEKALELLGKHFGIFEKDNEQRKPEINLSNLSTDQLLQLEQLLSATTGEGQ